MSRVTAVVRLAISVEALARSLSRASSSSLNTEPQISATATTSAVTVQRRGRPRIAGLKVRDIDCGMIRTRVMSR